MRVLVLSPMPPLRDGIAIYGANLVRAYLGAGYEVGVAATRRDPMPIGLDGREAEVVTTLPLTPLTAPVTAWKALRWRPDVVHVQHAVATYGLRLPGLLSVLMLLRLFGRQIVISHHEVTRDTDRLGWIGRVYYRFISALAQRVHVHTDGAASRLLECGSSRQAEVYPAPIFSLDHTFGASHAPSADEVAALRARLDGVDADGEPRVLVMMIGYLQNEKGHDRAVAALASLVERRPDLRDRVRLVFAGQVRPRPAGFSAFERADHEYEAAVRAQAIDAGLGDSVIWHGHVPDAELATWFAVADAVLLPYKAAEDSGIAAYAVAIGTPVLAAPVGGLAAAFRGTDLMLNSIRPDDIAVAIERFADNPQPLRAAARDRYDHLLRHRGPEGLIQTVTGASTATGTEVHS